MSLHNKRSAYTAQLDNAESIGANQTIVPALIKNITEKKTAKGKTYYRISVICMSNGDTFIKQAKSKDEDTEVKKQKVDGDEEVIPGTTVKPGQQFMATSYDRSCGGISQGVLVKLAVTTDWYIDHYTFKASKVMVDDRSSNVLTHDVYENKVVNTALAHIPTKDNFSPDDFPEGTEEKYITRSFITPLSSGVGTTLFSNVEIQIDSSNKDRFYSSLREDPVKYVGVNLDTGGERPTNMIKVVYTLNNDDETKILMTYAFTPEIWSCFGFTNVDHWKEVGGRLVMYAVDWLVYGYSNHNKIMSIMANMDGGIEDDEKDDGEDGYFEYSTGFITKMHVNIGDTARACGIPLSIEYIVDNYGPDSNYENDNEDPNHPINIGWKVAMKRNKPFVVNITDMNNMQVATFINEYKKTVKTNNVKFYGIYSVDSDAPYEIAAETDALREEQLVKSGMKPVVVFAVNKK